MKLQRSAELHLRRPAPPQDPALAGLLIAWQGVAAAPAVDAASFCAHRWSVGLLWWPQCAELGWGDPASRFRAGSAWPCDRPYVRRLRLCACRRVHPFCVCRPDRGRLRKGVSTTPAMRGVGCSPQCWGHRRRLRGFAVLCCCVGLRLLVLIVGSTLAIGAADAGQALAPTLLVARAFGALGGGEGFSLSRCAGNSAPHP